MLAWIRSPRGSTATATAVAAILALFWFAPWQKPLPFRMPFGLAGPTAPETAPPAPTDSPATAPQAAQPAPTPAVSAAIAPPSPAGGATAASAPATPPVTPSFDVVRVEPTGDAVIAGRADPGADVMLMDGDKAVAHVRADAGGQFALLPPSLPAGSHYLTLRVETAGKTAVASAQGVAVTIAAAAGTKPLVALLSPDKPTQILSDGSSTAPAGAGAPGTAGATPVAIQTVEAAEGGRFVASGVAHAGSQCRVYLNGAYLADVTAGKDGRWSVEIKKGMKPGRYTVRADELEPSSGKVVNRAEVPFDYPATVAGGEPKRLVTVRGGVSGAEASAPQASAAPPAGALASAAGPADATAPVPDGAAATQAVIGSLSTATVMRGDSLWRISRKMLGHGIQYTEIYASNVAQIRNPKLIYPGQIFVVPNKRVE